MPLLIRFFIYVLLGAIALVAAAVYALVTTADDWDAVYGDQTKLTEEP